MAGEFPDELVDKAISQTMCDPKSYVRRYALQKYGFLQKDLSPFMHEVKTLAHLVKTDETVYN